MMHILALEVIIKFILQSRSRDILVILTTIRALPKFSYYGLYWSIVQIMFRY